ncbi:MAG: hypothetical protein NZ703_02385 [Gemmataceae bacterium]|nr:hypothetical protein [Gemmataceae bacterium]MCS7269908.1 hypothetical protein [Gemmataceae bacterium]MDW8244103.1 hypothetical protein [Thermogemmata sp.]
MTSLPEKILLPTRHLPSALAETLAQLQAGDRIRITQHLRVGKRRWQATVEGTFRELSYLETGITTDRLVDDDIVVPVVRFVKDNGELSSITLDENTQIERLKPAINK